MASKASQEDHMRLTSIAVLAVAATLAAGLQPAGAVHNDRYCVQDDCNYHNWKQCMASAHCGWTFVGPAVTTIGCEHSRRIWLVCNRISSLQTRPRRLLPSGGKRGRSRSFLWACSTPSPAALSRDSTARLGTSPASPTTKLRWQASGLSCSRRSHPASSGPPSCSILIPSPYRLLCPHLRRRPGPQGRATKRSKPAVYTLSEAVRDGGIPRARKRRWSRRRSPDTTGAHSAAPGKPRWNRTAPAPNMEPTGSEGRGTTGHRRAKLTKAAGKRFLPAGYPRSRRCRG